MHHQVGCFVRSLQVINCKNIDQLKQVQVKISSIMFDHRQCFMYSEEEYKALLQGFTDLYSHIFDEKPLNEFGKVLLIDKSG